MASRFKDARNAVSRKYDGKILESRRVAFTDDWTVHLVRGTWRSGQRGTPTKVIAHNRRTDATIYVGGYDTIVAGLRRVFQISLVRCTELPVVIANEQADIFLPQFQYWQNIAATLVSENYEQRSYLLELEQIIPRSNLDDWRHGDCWACYRMTNSETGEAFTIKLLGRPTQQPGTDPIPGPIGHGYYFPSRGAFDDAVQASREGLTPSGWWDLHDAELYANPPAPIQASQDLEPVLDAIIDELAAAMPAQPTQPRNRVVLLGDAMPPVQLLETKPAGGIMRTPQFLHNYDATAGHNDEYVNCDTYIGEHCFGSLHVTMYADAAMRTACMADGVPLCMFDLPPTWHQVREVLVLAGMTLE